MVPHHSFSVLTIQSRRINLFRESIERGPQSEAPIPKIEDAAVDSGERRPNDGRDGGKSGRSCGASNEDGAQDGPARRGDQVDSG
jgi:hypothetical protein